MFGDYADAVALEAGARAGEMTDDVDTLYIGGGTPSVLPLSAFERITNALRQAGHSVPFEEFTVEVNPEDIVEKGHLYAEGLLKIGVNRISMGVQSFDDGILRWMNRRHDSAAAVKAYSILEDAGFDNISIDLIFGLPQLSEEKWSETIDKALSISSKGNKPCHISSYQLSVEPGSALAAMMETGSFHEADEDRCRTQYDVLCRSLAQAGYHHYEISNFALPGREARHNSAYWRHVPYVGLGPGAHSYCSDSRSWNIDDIDSYLEAASRGDFTSVCEREVLTREQLEMEKIMLALRTSAGISEDFLISAVTDKIVRQAVAVGDLVRLPDGCLRIPEERFFISDSIISSLV